MCNLMMSLLIISRFTLCKQIAIFAVCIFLQRRCSSVIERFIGNKEAPSLILGSGTKIYLLADICFNLYFCCIHCFFACQCCAKKLKTDGVGFEPTVRYKRTAVFKTAALNRSATHPLKKYDQLLSW